MATKGANAISKHYALERIQTALNRLLDDASIDPIDIARRHRYPDALHNQQLEVIADALEQLSPAPEVEPEEWEHQIDFIVSDGGFVADEKVDDFTVTPDGVIVASDEDGEPVVSDGQDEPDDLDDIDFEAPPDDDDDAATEADEKPARKRKGK